MASVCKNLTSSLSHAHIARRCCLFVQRRHRYKKKWAVNLPSKTSSELALEHFDTFYKPLFGHQWPSIRVSLLSLPKYAAIINNASESETSIQCLEEMGAIDLIQQAVRIVHKTKVKVEQDKFTPSIEESGSTSVDSVSHHVEQTDNVAEVSVKKEENKCNEIQPSEVIKSISELIPAEETPDTLPSSPASQMDALGQSDHDQSFHHVDDMKNLLTPDTVKHSTDLEYFMPTEQVFSDKEQLRQQEHSQSMYQERPVSVSVLPGQFPLLPKALKVMTFPPGDVSDFPRPLADKSHLMNYYLLDTASILPVLALDIRPNDYVLDLCAAPGGKTLALLQIILSQGGHLDSNDVSQSRVKRLKTVLKRYLLTDLQHEFVTVREHDGQNFRNPVYNKVLVDVPCNSDRHVLLEEDNNLFKPGRIKERLKLTTLQKDLLLAGVRSCKPGGSVVYSTCTLAAVQNDGVVQAAVEELWETSDIDVAVEDLAPLRTLFAPFFKFHTATRLGQLVLPSLVNNCGPMYFCKLRRLQ